MSISDPRAAALNILNHLNNRKRTLDAILDASAPMLNGLSGRDRALFNHLVYGVLRWRLRLDSIVDRCADRPLKKIAPPVLNILRMALFQILFMDRIPPSAAVNTAVNLVRTQRASHAAGFVNALLRRVLRDPTQLAPPRATDSALNDMAIAKSVPPWLVSRWIDRLGITETGHLCDAINAIPPITLRCNGLKNSLEAMLQALTDQAAGIEIMDDVPGAVHLVGLRCPIPEMKAFRDGRFAVQDGGAQLVSLLLDPQPGETVLDACAGVGGKTTHMAQIMHDKGRILAMDNVPAKLIRLQNEAHRLGVSIIETRHADLNRPLTSLGLPRFDRIVVDAPCSGLGVLRRNPDAKWSTRPGDILRLARQQMRFLNHLAPLLKKGGTLVYAVCSMEPEENEQVVNWFLKNQPDFAITGHQATAPKSVRPFMDENGFIRTMPHVHHLDGFFAARLRRVR